MGNQLSRPPTSTLDFQVAPSLVLRRRVARQRPSTAEVKPTTTLSPADMTVKYRPSLTVESVCDALHDEPPLVDRFTRRVRLLDFQATLIVPAASSSATQASNDS